MSGTASGTHAQLMYCNVKSLGWSSSILKKLAGACPYGPSHSVYDDEVSVAQTLTDSQKQESIIKALAGGQ